MKQQIQDTSHLLSFGLMICQYKKRKSPSLYKLFVFIQIKNCKSFIVSKLNQYNSSQIIN